MERALDPDLINLALGQQGQLPSPEELIETLAAAEVSLLLGDIEIDEQAIKTAWYLHGIASSHYALERYGIIRQRAAFKVSGHIFDLASRASSIDEPTRLKYCFAAQIAYLRSELNPNTLAIYKREFQGNLGRPSLLDDFPLIAFKCGVALLGMDVRFVFELGERLLAEISHLTTSWNVENIFETPFGAAAGVVLGCREILIFLVYGNEARLERAQQILRQSISSEKSEDDQDSRWIAAHLLNIIDGLASSSIWKVLPPDVPANARKAFAMASPKVLALWPPQIELLKPQENGNITLTPFSPDTRRLFISTPTSGGKTLFAQLIIAAHISTKNTAVCYVAPTRALCQEIRRSLTRRLHHLSTRIVDNLPDQSDTQDFFEIPPRVEVMTPERLSYLIRHNFQDTLARFGLFIFDEVHNVGDASRGWTLEEDLTLIHSNTLETNHRLILMSAAIGNRHHFINWLGDDSTEVLSHHSDWRAPRRLHCIWTTEPKWEDGIEETTKSSRYPTRTIYPLYGTLYARVHGTSRSTRFQTTEEVGKLALQNLTDGSRSKDQSRSTPFYITIVSLAQTLARFGSVMIIESTRRATLSMAKALAEVQEASDDPVITQLTNLISAHLGEDHPLKGIVERGVAYHHGSLPNEIRAAIENAVSNGHLHFIVATTTMTEGVNLPVHSVIVASQGSFQSHTGYQEYITGSKLINAIGRAGRAGKETEGIVVLARNTGFNESDFNRLDPSDEDLQIRSWLASEEALEELTRFENLVREAEDTIIEIASNVVSRFLSFVWFVASELEKTSQLPDENNIIGIFQKSLAWVQLRDEDKLRWTSVLNSALSSYLTTPSDSRIRWASSGTSIRSARQLESISQEINLLFREQEEMNPTHILEVILEENRLVRIMGLSESPSRKLFTQRSGKRSEILVPLVEVLSDWVNGYELKELGEKYLSDVSDIDYRSEQLGDFINDYFETFFPWILNTIVNWTNSLNESESPILPVELPSYVRCGVNNRIALNLLFQGIDSRHLALAISEQWQQAEHEETIWEWIRSMDIVEWQNLFEVTKSELQTLIEFSKRPEAGLLFKLLDGEEVLIEVKTNRTEDDLPKSIARLEFLEDSEISQLAILVEDQLVGIVPSSDHAEMMDLIDTDLIIDSSYSVVEKTGWLHLRIIEPED